MVNVLVFNNATNGMERHALQLHSPMPYVTGGTLTVREFRARSSSNIIWTDIRAMRAWNTTRAAWGRGIYVGAAFKRISEGGHANQSQHYAGVSFDVGQNLTAHGRSQLRATATNVGVWSYVDMAYIKMVQKRIAIKSAFVNTQ